MKILILTQYYPPESGAPQNRLSDLAKRLKAKGNDVAILTALPNYPKMEIFKGYKGKFYLKETIEGSDVHRSYIFVSKSKSVIPRLFNYFSFVITSIIIAITKLSKIDLLICESPPLFLGISAMIIAHRKNAKLIFNVSDLWPESAEKLNIVNNKRLLKWAYKLEAKIYNKSWLMSGQTQGIVNNIKNRFPEKDVVWLKNGIDFQYFDENNVNQEWRRLNQFSEDDFLLVYAGVIGHAQGLEVIIKAANLLKNQNSIKFLIVGNGPEKESLVYLNEQLKNENVYFFDLIPREQMPSLIYASNAAIIPLKKLDIFKGAIPSKIFESLAFKKPILLGIEGEAYDLFIREGKCGLAFEPENETALAKSIVQLYENKKLYNELSANAIQYVKNFDREKIAEDFWENIQRKLKNES